MIRLPIAFGVALLIAAGYGNIAPAADIRLPLVIGGLGVQTKSTVTVEARGTPTLTPTPTATATEKPIQTSPPTATGTTTSTPTVTPANSPEPTDTQVPPTLMPVSTATPAHDPMDMHWHAPAAHGDRPVHEHGDAPPQWVLDAGYNPSFDHLGSTPNENHAYYKHTAFKGWLGQFSGVDWYGVFHLDFNPGGHVSRFHSYQLWLRDSTGAVSHMNGWLDFGQDNNTTPNLIISCGTNSNVRPIINVNQVGCPIFFETWYSRAGGSGEWSIDLGISINPNYFAGGDPTNPATWTNTGYVRNLTRLIGLAWYANRSDLRGEFYTTQWGDVVSGPNDPMCGTTRTIGERTYTVACLRQYIAPTLPNIQFPGNSVQRTFVGNGVVLPN